MTEAPPTAWTVDGGGPPLVFLHGYGAHSRYWRPWLPYLTARYTCIRIDLPGFGTAPAPADGDYSPRGLASAVVATLHHLDLRGVTLVGHSLGGGVALLSALELLDRAHRGEPARLSRLVSVAGAAYRQHEPPFVRLARKGSLADAGFALLPKRWLVRKAMEAIVVQTDAVTDERVEDYARPMRDPARRRAFLECARRIVPDDLDDLMGRIPEIDVPALCLWGRQDPVVPLSIGRRLARELPRGRLEVLDACGHQVVEERPEASARRLLSFLADTDPQESSTGGAPVVESSGGDPSPSWKPEQRRTGRTG